MRNSSSVNLLYSNENYIRVNNYDLLKNINQNVNKEVNHKNEYHLLKNNEENDHSIEKENYEFNKLRKEMEHVILEFNDENENVTKKENEITPIQDVNIDIILNTSKYKPTLNENEDEKLKELKEQILNEYN